MRTKFLALSRCTKLLSAFALIAVAGLSPATTLAQDEAPNTLFQLNGFAGSPAQPGKDGLKDPDPATTVPPGYPCNYGAGSTTCDDWNLINGAGGGTGANGHSTSRVFFTASTLVFRQGSTDTQDPTQWAWQPGSSPGKDAFNAAYAAGYHGPFSGDNIVEFGADRATNNGDLNLGVWFFQKAVVTGTAVSGGKTVGIFSCGLPAGQSCHTNHDIFVISAFTGGGGTSTITVFEWDTSCSSGVKNPGAGDCSDANLRLLLPTSTVCGSSFECAVTNPAITYTLGPNGGGVTHTSWEGAIASPQFFEGGVNISAALKGVGVTTGICFSTVQMETRASQSTSAELKAFVIHSFPECQMQISKSCATSANPVSPYIHYIGSTPYIHYDFNVTVTNPTTGGGTIFDPTISDTFPPNSINWTLNGQTCSSASCTQEATPSGGITVGNHINIAGSFDFPGEGTVTNKVTGTAASSEGGAQNVTGTTTGDSTGSTTASADFGAAGSTCSTGPHGVLGLTKFCDITLVGDLQKGAKGAVYLRLDDTITVCNNSTDSTTKISNISIENTVTKGPSNDLVGTVPNALGPGDCYTFTKSYTPTDCDNDLAAIGNTTYPNGSINPILNGDGTVATTPVAGRCEFSDTAFVSSTPTDEFGGTVTAPMPAPAQCNLCLNGFCTSSSVTH